MGPTDQAIEHYAARDIEERLLAAIRAAGLDPEQRLSPTDLSALDHFHTGGLQASHELMALAQIRAEDRVLDVGAGLAGAARLMASEIGCRVDCIELSADYCAGAALLNRLTGLDDKVEVHEGSALELPFPDNSFTVAWMQNVGMNRRWPCRRVNASGWSACAATSLARLCPTTASSASPTAASRCA